MVCTCIIFALLLARSMECTVLERWQKSIISQTSLRLRNVASRNFGTNPVRLVANDDMAASYAKYEDQRHNGSPPNSLADGEMAPIGVTRARQPICSKSFSNSCDKNGGEATVICERVVEEKNTARRLVQGRSNSDDQGRDADLAYVPGELLRPLVHASGLLDLVWRHLDGVVVVAGALSKLKKKLSYIEEKKTTIWKERSGW